MKTKLFLLGALTLLVAACQDELQQPVNQAMVGDLTPLCIQVVANPATKAYGKVSGSSLPAGSYIGMYLLDGSIEGTYDNTDYSNISYRTSDGTNWISGSTKILLSATKGTVYAYYPYSLGSAPDPKSVPIAVDELGRDFMYATALSDINNSNASVVLTMNHALSNIVFTIVKASTNGYTGAGDITSVKVEGATVAAKGTMDITNDGAITASSGSVFCATPLSLNGTNTGEVFAIPTGANSPLKFTVLMDGQAYTTTTEAVTLQKGQQYAYKLSMSSTGLSVSQVNVTEWADAEDKGSFDTDLSAQSIVTCTTEGMYLYYSLSVNDVVVLDRIRNNATFECEPGDVIKIFFEHQSPGNAVKVDGNSLTLTGEQTVTFTATKSTHNIEVHCALEPDIPEIV
ncbi:MAG: fimbrillin family protein [Parabacteroides sp.]